MKCPIFPLQLVYDAMCSCSDKLVFSGTEVIGWSWYKESMGSLRGETGRTLIYYNVMNTHLTKLVLEKRGAHFLVHGGTVFSLYIESYCLEDYWPCAVRFSVNSLAVKAFETDDRTVMTETLAEGSTGFSLSVKKGRNPRNIFPFQLITSSRINDCVRLCGFLVSKVSAAS